jgi:hypothetical protein
MRKLLFNYSFYSDPEIGKFQGVTKRGRKGTCKGIHNFWGEERLSEILSPPSLWLVCFCSRFLCSGTPSDFQTPNNQKFRKFCFGGTEEAIVMPCSVTPPPRLGTRPDPRGYPGPGSDTGPLKFQRSVRPGMVCSRPKTPLILPNPTGIRKSSACSWEQTPHARGRKREAALVAAARGWQASGVTLQHLWSTVAEQVKQQEDLFWQPLRRLRPLPAIVDPPKSHERWWRRRWGLRPRPFQQSPSRRWVNPAHPSLLLSLQARVLEAHAQI